MIEELLKPKKFTATLDIIGINPFVFVPENILESVFRQAGKTNGPVPVCGKVNGKPYTQTLVRFRGAWRLYINTMMLKDSPKRVGETLEITVVFDPRERVIEPHPKFLAALNRNRKAKQVFEALRPSLQKEIIRYLAALKTETSLDRNVVKAIGFLLGKERFIGRDGLH